MAYIPLLERQIKKYFKGEIPAEFLPLFEAINNSYQHYERDHALGIKSLEISSKEQQQLAEDKEEKKERIKTILNSASDGILVLNDKGIIQDCNNAALRYFSYSEAEEVVGKNVNIIPIKTTKSSIPLLDLLEQTSTKKLYEFEIQRKESSLQIEVSVSDLFVKSERLKICILRDITERKMHEKASELRHDITHLLVKTTSYNDSIPKILSMICQELEWDASVFWENGTNPLFIYNPDSLDLKLKNRVEPFHFDKDSILHEKQSFFKSVVLIPVQFETNLLGVIQLFSKQEKKVEFDDKIKTDIAAEIALFIEKELIRKREIKLQQELVTSAKHAGMMQVANSVLHNVGNVLNSVNVSASLLRENLNKSEMNNLMKIASMLKEHLNEMPAFLCMDLKGKLIPPYLIELSQKWEEELSILQKETKIIIQNINNIKNVINTQLSPDDSSTTIERASIKALIDEVIEMKESELKSNRINIIRNYDIPVECLIDKSRLTQVIVNLINNAIDATQNQESREIEIRTENTGAALLIHFSDNGAGLDLNQLEKLFSYGFTTKKTGHGLGLHNSLKQIKEMGGDLKATSSGKTKGATFSISLPLESPLVSRK